MTGTTPPFATPCDGRVVHAAPPWAVLASRQEVMFRDGSAVHLHPVLRAGVPDTFTRAMRHGEGWLLIDLRHHGAEIEADILRLQPRATPGVIFFTLRTAYTTAAQFVARAGTQATVYLVRAAHPNTQAAA